MIARVFPSTFIPKGRRGEFAARLDYICAPGKASSIGVENMAGDWADASAQMQMVATLGAGAGKNCYHFVLSVAPDEQPTDFEWHLAARMVLSSIGAREHQAVMAVHRDREHTHIHVVFNRVHPLTHKTWSTWEDYKRMEKACREVEHRFGWPQDNGHYDSEISPEGDIILVPKPEAYLAFRKEQRERGFSKPSDRQLLMERFTGGVALERVLEAPDRRNLKKLIKESQSWTELHKRLKIRGLEYRLHGKRGRIIDLRSGFSMNASRLRPSCDYRALKARDRLGPYQPPDDAHRNIKAGFPLSLPAIDSHQRYDVQRLKANRADMVARKKRRQECKARHKVERQELAQHIQGWRNPIAAALRRHQKQVHREERENLAEKCHPRLITPERLATLPSAIRYAETSTMLQAYTPDATISSTVSSHVFCRQSWLLSDTLGGHDKLPEGRRDIVANLPDVRASREGDLILRLRAPDGRFCGYRVEAMHKGRSSTDVVKGGLLGISAWGTLDAPVCLIVADVQVALDLAINAPSSPHSLLVIPQRPLPGAQMKELGLRLKGRRLICISDRQHVPSQFLEGLEQQGLQIEIHYCTPTQLPNWEQNESEPTEFGGKGYHSENPHLFKAPSPFE